MIKKETIKANVNISSVLSVEGYNLIKVSTHQYKIHCLNPEHPDDNPSLQISDSKRLYKCFSCGIGGDVINILDYIKPEIQSFGEKLEYLNNYIGNNIDNSISLSGQEKISNFQDEKEYINIMNFILNYYSIQLTKELQDRYILNNNKTHYRAFKGGLNTIIGYNLSENIIKEFKLGYSPNNKELFNLLSSKYDKGLIDKTNLFMSNGLPKFRNRIIMPYLMNGNAVHFIARQTEFTPVNKFEEGKYINQSVNNKYLYNESDLDNVCIFITEGGFDTLALKSIGYNSIALGGLNMTNIIKDKLIEGLKECFIVYIAFDNDEAGNKRAIEVDTLLKENGINSSIVLIPLNRNKKKIDINEYLGTHSKRDLDKLLTF